MKLIDKTIKPIMSDEVESDVLDALSQYQNKDKWMLWGMDTLRKQGSAIFLYGPSGTGKTTIARWAAKQIKRGFIQLDISKIGGGDPGSVEKNVKEFFDDCRKRNGATIFMDECDHLLGNRNEVTDDTWMIGTIEMLMMQMNNYAGLIICASNNIHKVDPALANRFLAIVHVDEPDYAMRIRLWKQKWPKKFPLQPTEDEINKLAKPRLNGRQIETVLVRTASHAIRKGVKPKLSMIELFTEAELGKHIPDKE
jgi:SpoVK/Ycf46/Vps4 family AAA+-type ATPase